MQLLFSIAQCVIKLIVISIASNHACKLQLSDYSGYYLIHYIYLYEFSVFSAWVIVKIVKNLPGHQQNEAIVYICCLGVESRRLWKCDTSN